MTEGDKVNVRRIANQMSKIIDGSLYDEENERFIPWTKESYEAYLTGLCDDLVERGGITRYHIENVSVDDSGAPSGDVFIVPVSVSPFIQLNFKITQEIVEFTENSS